MHPPTSAFPGAGRPPLRTVVSFGLLLFACTSDPTGVAARFEPTPLPPLATGVVAVVGADVATMAGPGVLEDHTVLIRDGVIEAVAPAAALDPPGDAEVVSGEGLWLMPGLVDMHVHLRRRELAAYRRAGITTVRNMWGTPQVAELLAEAADGADHPTILSAGPGMDGDPPVWGGSDVVTSPGAARAAVRRQVADGWSFIKVYNRLGRDVYRAILDQAAEAGIGVIGHVPLASDIHEAAAGGHASVEHLTGIAEAVADGRSPGGWLRFDADRAGAVAAELADRGTWVCPTLAVLRHLADRNLSPDQATLARRNQGAMVRALRDAGVPLLAGTDAGIDAVPAGTTLALELELLVEAGLTPLEALRAATTDAARFLGIDAEIGTVEVGKRADLVLLGTNPLEDVGAVRDPVGLIQRGKVLVAPAPR